MPTSNTCVKIGERKVAMQSVPYPDEPEPGQALIRTTLSTVNSSDIHLVDETPVPPGRPMGHEAVGIVEAVGAGVTAFTMGDRVVASCFTCCGQCTRCLEGNHQVCETGNMIYGAQGEFFIVNGAQTTLAKVPEDLTDEQVLFTTDIMSTGFGALERAEMRPGDTVAVFAQGPVGLCATAGARTYGAGLIIAVEPIPARVAMSKRLGADIVLDPANAVDEIMRLTDNRGVDVAVEALGNQVTFENCCRVARSGGTVSSVGYYGAFPTLTLPTDGSFMHRKIVTTLCPAGTDRLTRLMALVKGGRVDLTPLFTHSMKLGETPEAYDLFREHRDEVLKIALRP